ncbi:MAG: hypothetical protein ACP5IC_02460 [Minisyncoccia bacterium]
MIIDGGIAQYNAVKKILVKTKLKNIQVISFAKDLKNVYGLDVGPKPLMSLDKNWQDLILKVIYYTHNFAIKFHRKKRKDALFNSY